MEVWLEIESGKTIFFNGKMARVVYPGDEGSEETGPGIAIKIVQIDSENDRGLQEFVSGKSLERKEDNGEVA